MAKSQTLKRKIYFIPCYMIFFQSFRLRHLAPFDWKFLQIGTQRAKDLRKNVSILQQGGLTTVPPTQPVVRLVLLHKQPDLTKVFEVNSMQNCSGGPCKSQSHIALFALTNLVCNRVSEQSCGGSYLLKPYIRDKVRF